ncbi:hypothetical protein FA15DRAFT_297969 [Coprinopsis marcescibilis]|uniref:Microbial-type PARG catalytic domain-containing protein n=1 Tax=Coprinopsis marcescibilis TaxID=230819 RepID=A0A5C3L037_COPMA|nr:hypothetical protein FA15DRAFT_297969 [Coprinopsis marcescibilis]
MTAVSESEVADNREADAGQIPGPRETPPPSTTPSSHTSRRPSPSPTRDNESGSDSGPKAKRQRSLRDYWGTSSDRDTSDHNRHRSRGSSSRRGKGKGNARQNTSSNSGKEELREIASSTLEAIDAGSYECGGTTYQLKETVDAMIDGTLYFSPDSDLGQWAENAPAAEEGDVSLEKTEFTLVECSTLEGCKTLHALVASLPDHTEGLVDKRVGLLNFASAKKPGGGFINGARAQVWSFLLVVLQLILLKCFCLQEESIARSSTLYASLMIDTAQEFYEIHRKDPHGGYYSHAMIYTPRVQLLRDDAGGWHAPIEVEVVTSPAVNAGVVRRAAEDEDAEELVISSTMKERMARILYLFEKQGIKNLVLGSFGTGVFQNRVQLVCELWVQLLIGEGARFGKSFDRVMFAVLGPPTFKTFQEVVGAAISGAPDSTDGDAQKMDVDGESQVTEEPKEQQEVVVEHKEKEAVSEATETIETTLPGASVEPTGTK